MDNLNGYCGDSDGNRTATDDYSAASKDEKRGEFVQKCADAGITSPKLAFIGGGNMAGALIDGFVASGALFRDEIAISVQSQSSVSRWKKLGFENVYTNNNEMLKHHGNGIVFLAIKPQQLDSVMEELSGESLHRTKILVSIMSGINIETLQKHASQKGGQGTRVLRMMPTIPASLGASASAIAAGKSTPQSQVDVVAYLAECVGKSFVIAEKCFDVATAVTGCGTASVFTMIEALADGGVLGGLPRSTALALASQTIMGAAKMALESDEHPAKLRDNVCSPAGITICGVRELERHGARSALIEAVNASTQRSKELSQL